MEVESRFTNLHGDLACALYGRNMSVCLATMVKALDAPTQCSLICARGSGSIPGADNLDSGFHLSGVGKIRCNSYLGDHYRRLRG